MKLKLILIIIGVINQHEKQSFDHYASNMQNQYKSVGAVVIDKYPIVHSVFEDEKPDFILVVEFPSADAYKALFSGDTYKELIPYREKGFSKLNVFISQK